MSCAEMASKVGVAHKISRVLTRAVYLAPPPPTDNPGSAPESCITYLFNIPCSSDSCIVLRAGASGPAGPVLAGPIFCRKGGVSNTWPYVSDEANDLAYCHTCVKGFKEKKMKAAKADAAFVSVYVVR